MKVTFLEPPPLGPRTPERFAGCSYELYHFPDLANLYPLACLKELGCEVGYIDAVLEGLSEEAFLERMERDDSSYYVIHSVVLSKRTDLYYIRKIKRLKPKAKFILHGPEPTRAPEEYLLPEFGSDVTVLRGEVEESLVGYVLKGGLSGASVLRDGDVLHYPPSGPVDVDSLPFPMRTFEGLRPHLHRYFNPKFRGRPYTVLMASRGCSFRCRFCVPNSISFAREIEHRRYFGRKPGPSVASSARVLEEFRRVKEEGFRSVMVVDDQFLWGKRRTLEICDGVKDMGLEWGCLSRADFLTDEEVVRALAEAGCVSVDIGAESFNQKVLDDIRKDMKVEDVFRAVELLKGYGIRPKLNIMFGASEVETEEDIVNTVRALKKMGLKEVMFSVATPFKGTEFYEWAAERGLISGDPEDVDPLGKSTISYPHLSGEDLERLLKYAYRSFYLRPSVVASQLRRAISNRSLLEGFRTIVRLL